VNKRLKVFLIIVGVLVIVLIIGYGYLTRSIALDTIYLTRKEPEQTPADFGLQYEQITVTTSDGLDLVGWYVPGDNGATIIAQHGSPGPMQDNLYEASVFHAEGYNVLLSAFRAHGLSEGDMLSFGYHETKDLEAWYQYLLTRDDVDPERIGIFGESMGGGVAIMYAAQNPKLKAVATASAFAISQETIETFIQYEQPDLPRWLVPILARGIVFWAEREWGIDIEVLETQSVVAEISPRPILIMHGESDDKVGPSAGQMLCDAAAEPKECWIVKEVKHVDFEKHVPEEYKQRLVTFFGKNLLEQ